MYDGNCSGLDHKEDATHTSIPPIKLNGGYIDNIKETTQIAFVTWSDKSGFQSHLYFTSSDQQSFQPFCIVFTWC